MELGRIERVDPRQVWGHEARDMTPWLLANEGVLADVLGIDLELTVAEHPVGAFSLDLLGRDLTHDCVLIVENQMTPTDHDHLGKLLTYAAGTDAQTVVWVAPSFREQHREALDLLNRLGEERVRFFGVQLGIVRIGDSPPAPLFELQAQPNDWAAQLASTARAAAKGTGKPALYMEFWGRFLEEVRSHRPGWTRARKPTSDSWFTMPSPFRSEASYSVNFSRGARLRSELYVDSPNEGRVESLFSALLARREAIELRYGGPLHWEELPNRRASRIADYTEGDVAVAERADTYIAWLIDSQTRLRGAIEAVAEDVREEVGAR
jgi:hypothetical protein